MAEDVNRKPEIVTGRKATLEPPVNTSDLSRFTVHGSRPYRVESPLVINMHRPKHLALGIIILLALVTVVVAYVRHPRLPGFILSRTSRASSEQPMPVDNSPAAHEFASGNWINSEPLTLKRLRGRVVLVDFWTFACYNCRNTLPYVKKWDTRYRDKGLTIVGVHSPELDEERVLENVKRETASLGIRYPVVTDNDYATWRAYEVEAWPTLFLVDKQGHIRWSHVGEGDYEKTEKLIQQLLAEEAKPSP